MGPPVATIYFQGMANTQVSAALYSDRLRATTGEVVRFPGALPLLYNPWPGKELDEVDFGTKHSFVAYYTWLYNWYLGYRFENNSKLYWYNLHRKLGNLGQTDDMIEHSQKVASAEGRDLILFGYSRGAIATFNALAHYHYPRVRLVILEAVVDSQGENLSRLSLKQKLLFHCLLPIFAPANQSNALAPIDVVDQFPVAVPVALISVRGDDTSHIDGQCRLARALAERGVSIYHLIVEGTGHTPIPLHPPAIRHQVLVFLHALYRQCNLPHIESLADEGYAVMQGAKLGQRGVFFPTGTT